MFDSSGNQIAEYSFEGDEYTEKVDAAHGGEKQSDEEKKAMLLAKVKSKVMKKKKRAMPERGESIE